jgi:hypothetical protein
MFQFSSSFPSPNNPPTRTRQLLTQPDRQESINASQPSQRNHSDTNPKKHFFFRTCVFSLTKSNENQEHHHQVSPFLGIFTSRNGSTKSLATMGEEALRRQLEQRLRPHGPSSWAEALAYEVTRHLGQQLGKLWEKWIKMGEKEEITGKNIFMNSDNKAIAVSLDEPNFRIHFLPAKNEGTIKHMASNQL